MNASRTLPFALAVALSLPPAVIACGSGGSGGHSTTTTTTSGTGGHGGSTTTTTTTGDAGVCGVAPTKSGADCVLPATITTNMTIGSECQPWHIGASGTQVGDPSSPVLTIKPCVTIEVDPGGSLLVAGAAGPGALVAVGNAQEPITFTSSAATPMAGDWGPVAVLDGALYPTTTLQYVDFEYGGGNFGNGPQGTLVVDSTPGRLILLHDLTLSHNLVDGIHLMGAGATTGVGFAPGSGNLTIKDWGTGHSPILLALADAAGTVPTTLTTGAGGHDGQVEIVGYAVDVTQTWASLPIPYLVDTNLQIEGVGNSTATLTITAPNVVQFQASGYLAVDPAATDQGYLVAKGTNGNIVFTTNSPNPAAGSWEGIRFDIGPGGQGASTLTGCKVEYAGATGLESSVCSGGGSCTAAPIVLGGACLTPALGPTISGCTVENFPPTDSGMIIYGMPTNAASYTNNTFSGGATGVCQN